MANTTTNIGRAALHGGIVVTVAEVFSGVLKIASTIVLARILEPEDFGVVGMVSALMGFAERFKELGLGDAAVQARNITKIEISNLFWANLCFCCLVAGIFAVLSDLFALYYRDLRVGPVTVALASTFIVSGAAIQHQALLRRNLKFGVLGGIGIMSTCASVTIAIVSARLGMGYWSLVARDVTRTLVFASGLWVCCSWFPDWPDFSVSIRRFMSFGKSITGVNILQLLARSADRMILGRIGGADATGLYTMGATIVGMPVSQMVYPIQTVAFSTLSAIGYRNVDYARLFEKIVRVLCTLTMPIVVYIAVFSDVIVITVLNEKWRDAIPIMRVLAVGAFIEPVAFMVGSALMAAGHGKRYFQLGFILSLIRVCLFGIGALWGVYGLAAGYVASCYASVIIALEYGLGSAGISERRIGRAVLEASICSGVLAILLCIMRTLSGWNDTSLSLAIIGLIAVAAYCVLGLFLLLGFDSIRLLKVWGMAVVRKLRE